MTEEKFEEDKFMKILVNLKDTQESIQGFSGWCIRSKKSAYKMARCWIKVIKKVRIEQKLVLFYLVNDIVQHSAKRGYGELLDKFRSAIKEAMPHLKEEKIGPKVQRCLDIWDERDVFDAEYIQELTSLIDLTPVKEDQEIVENFQPQLLCTQIKIMKALEDDADYKLKTLKENDLDNQDIEEMKLKLKDKHCGDEFVHEFEDGTKRMEQYIKAMEREITKRRQVIELLGQGKKYYDSLFGEAEIVATAYSNFGNRVKKVEGKLAEKMPLLVDKDPGGSGESPVPSPDYDAPSPEGSDDEMEIRLPDESSNTASAGINPDLSARLSSMTASGSDLTSRLSSLTGVGDEPQTTPPPSKENYSISEFLTKIAHGEKLDVSSFIGGGGREGRDSDRKRRRLSGEGFAGGGGIGSYDPATGGMFDTPAPRSKDPWSEELQEPVPEWLSRVDDEPEVENIALARLRQAANKTNKTGGDNGVMGVTSSNLVSLTGSPAGKGDKDRRVSGGSKSRHGGSDMDMSEDEEGEIRDNFLEEGFPPPHREQRDQWQGEDGSWENGVNISAEGDYDHHQGRPLSGVSPDRHFSKGLPPRFPPPQPGFKPQDESTGFPSPNIHHGPPPRPPPPFRPPGSIGEQPSSDNLLASGELEHNMPIPSKSFGPRFDSPNRGGFDGHESHRGGHRGGFDGPRPYRGSFEEQRGGFGPRGLFDGPRFPGPPPNRFNSPQGRGGFKSERFASPVNNFSDSGPGSGNGIAGPGRGDSPGDRFDNHSDMGFDSPRGRGGFRGGFNKNMGFDGPSDFDVGRGGFDGRGRGGRGGWNGSRRPWGNPRGRRGHW